MLIVKCNLQMQFVKRQFKVMLLSTTVVQKMETHSFAAFVLPLATNELCQWSLCAPKMLLTVLDVRPQFKACSCDCLINTERVKDGKAINGIPSILPSQPSLVLQK